MGLHDPCGQRSRQFTFLPMNMGVCASIVTDHDNLIESSSLLDLDLTSKALFTGGQPNGSRRFDFPKRIACG